MARRQKWQEDLATRERNDRIKAEKDAYWNQTYNKNVGLNPDGSAKPKPLPVSGDNAPVYEGGGLGIDSGSVVAPVVKQAPVEKQEDPFEVEIKRQKYEAAKKKQDAIDADLKQRLEKENAKKETSKIMFRSIYNWTKNAKTPEEKKVAVAKLNEFGKSLGLGQLLDVGVDENGQFLLTEAGANGQPGMVHTIPYSKFEDEYADFNSPENVDKRTKLSMDERRISATESRSQAYSDAQALRVKSFIDPKVRIRYESLSREHGSVLRELLKMNEADDAEGYKQKSDVLQRIEKEMADLESGSVAPPEKDKQGSKLGFVKGGSSGEVVERTLKNGQKVRVRRRADGQWELAN